MLKGISFGLFGQPERSGKLSSNQKTPITFLDQPVRKPDIFSRKGDIARALKDTGTDGAMETPE